MSRPAARPGTVAAVVGLALGLALGLGVEHWVLARARAAAADQSVERRAVLELAALTQLVDRLGGRGEGVREAVERFTGPGSGLVSVRVIAFEGLSLEASTAPEDTGDAAAPRRLAREEKPLYDQGQRLRAAVETNRQEGGFREDEIEVETTPEGVLALAAPVETGDGITGAVLAETSPPPPPPRPSPLWPLAFAAAALVLMLLLVRLLPGRLPRAAAALLLLAAAVGLYAWLGMQGVAAEGLAAEEAVAARLADTAGRMEPLAAELGVVGLDPASWDVDRFRRPRERVTAAGEVERGVVEESLAEARGRLARVTGWVFAAAAILTLFLVLGGAGRLGHTVVRNRVAYAYVLPAMISMLVLVFLPFGYGITLSFTQSNLYNLDRPLTELWVGLANYFDILGDVSVVKQSEGGQTFDFENFYWTLGFTVVWTITNVVWGVTLGLILALILNTAGLALRPAYRVLLILPWAVPNYITALVWKGMFHQQLGIINQVVQMLGGTPVAWFESPFTSFLAIWATNGWLSFPFMMVISLGALQSIPGELYEAARVDGASRWQQLTSITLPSLKPALVPAVIISVIWTFNMFNIPYLTSAGEPAHATEILITQGYKIAFEKYQYGYAAAYATIIFLILLVYGTWQNRVTRATEGI